ncbi:MAG: hypothetical protein ABEJ44_03065 [Halanaeroarchaeum sp.]
MDVESTPGNRSGFDQAEFLRTYVDDGGFPTVANREVERVAVERDGPVGIQDLQTEPRELVEHSIKEGADRQR